jgi:membrane protein DedA with SNARE-associated domain
VFGITRVASTAATTPSELGYLALFIGTLLEGETIVFLAGLAAHHGYLWFPAVVAVAVIGGFLGDQFFLFLGRRYGNRIFTRFPGLATRAPYIQALLRRWDVHAILLVRFLYGLRMAALIVIGSCRISPWRVALFDFLGVVLWAFVVAGLGYFAGQAVQQLTGRLDASVVLLLLALALIAGTAWKVVRSLRR